MLQFTQSCHKNCKLPNCAVSESAAFCNVFFPFQNSNTSSSSFCHGFLRGARPVFRRALFILWQKVYHLAIGGVHSTPAPPGYGPAYMVFFDSVCFLALQITSTEKHFIRCNLKKCIFHCRCKIGLVYNLYKKSG